MGMIYTHTKLMFKSQSVQNKKSKQTDGQTDDTDCSIPPRLTRSAKMRENTWATGRRWETYHVGEAGAEVSL